ncbi:MAG TPA: hypothetical protein VF506_20105, partial [Streptosporangiaceae bacterium]
QHPGWRGKTLSETKQLLWGCRRMPGRDGTDAQIAVTQKVCNEVRIERIIGGRIEQDAGFGMVPGDKHSENAPVNQGV